MAKRNPLTSQLHDIGLSQPYASQVANGKRTPSLKKALHIYRELGIALGPIAGKSAREISAMTRAASVLGVG